MSSHILLIPTDGSEGGYSETVAVDNALEVQGTPAAGQTLVVQADGSVQWASLS